MSVQAPAFWRTRGLLARSLLPLALLFGALARRRRQRARVYTLPVPVKVVAVRATDVCVSGWMVSVKDIDGNVRDLDSGHFSRYKP